MQNIIHRGFIKKILQAEGYGFIETENNNLSVFFHKTASNTFESLQVGELVEFSIVDTPKGKAAKDVTKLKSSFIRKLAKGFTFTKRSNPDYGNVIYRKTVKTNWFCSPVKARDSLRDIAHEAGCNAVFNMTCKRKVIAKGYNYFGTVHEYKAEIAIVVNDVATYGDDTDRLQSVADREIDHRLYLASLADKKRNEVQEKALHTSGKSTLLLFLAFLASLPFAITFSQLVN